MVHYLFAGSVITFELLEFEFQVWVIGINKNNWLVEISYIYLINFE